jgi:universal stress protein A
MGFPYRKILCPIDFDENSLAALDEAIEVAHHFNAAIALVHVIPIIVQYGEVAIAPQIYAQHENEARAKLAALTEKKLVGIIHEEIIYTGDITGSILQSIGRFGPDIVVMATHGRSGIAHLILGSVAEAVVRKANCPVLTIRRAHSS